MPNISITVKNKVARADRVIIICDNSDYTAVFDFDDEWSAYDTKTARFVSCGTYTDVVFTGNECPIPIIQDTRSLTVGVYAGDLHTTTPAYISCVPSILCGNGIPADPTPDVYAQIMELLNKESGIWYPAVDDAGNMSWTRSMSETEPQPVNIKGQKGDAGADGVDGKSAYELAQDNGFAGTMQEWLASLVGADGANGADGNDGISPTVSVAAITGGNRVTITDAEGAKTFDVMDGAQGKQGNNGADGKDYVLTDTDKQEIAKTAAGLVDVPSVQPDWNQNDSTQPDYVKNRPFYTGNPVETVLVEDINVSFSNPSASIYYGSIPTTLGLIAGDAYKVSWDGATYECVCELIMGYPAIGSPSIMGAGADTGEPFLILPLADNQGAEVYTLDTSTSHTISISGFVQEVVKIDEKYIPALDYLDKNNPTGTGAFSMNRKVNSDIGQYSVALGENCVASGKSSISVGDGTEATELTAQAFGWHTEANARFSHAEGAHSKVSTNASEEVVPRDAESGAGIYGHAEGFCTLVTGGIGAHAEGAGTLASGSSSHAEGYKTIASGENQHVQGKYNIEDSSNTYAHIVGNGTSSSARSNAHTLDWDGNAWYAGTVEGKALIIPSSTTGSTKKFKITVDDSGAPTITNESDSTNTWRPTNLPTVTASDAGKFLRVSDTGEWVAETIPNASGVSF